MRWLRAGCEFYIYLCHSFDGGKKRRSRIIFKHLLEGWTDTVGLCGSAMPGSHHHHIMIRMHVLFIHIHYAKHCFIFASFWSVSYYHGSLKCVCAWEQVDFNGTILFLLKFSRIRSSLTATLNTKHHQRHISGFFSSSLLFRIYMYNLPVTSS